MPNTRGPVSWQLVLLSGAALAAEQGSSKQQETITERQALLIRKRRKNICLCFDIERMVHKGLR
jgi:uncharacterized membrane protein